MRRRARPRRRSRRWPRGSGRRRPRRSAPCAPAAGRASFWAMHAFVVGFGLGFFVALQLGPMSLLLVRSTLRGGWRVGLAIGAGVAVVDALYAACGVAGAAPLLTIGP